MNEIWTFTPYPEELPDPCTISIDTSTDPPTVTTSPMPAPATIAGEGYRRLLDLCFDRADQFSLHRCGYAGSQPGGLERALRPFQTGEYRSYACVHVHGEAFWEQCCLYRADPAAKEILLGRITHLFDREAEDPSWKLPEKYRAYEEAMEAARKRFDDYMDRAGDDLDFEEMDAFDRENFREAKGLWKEVFDPADFSSHMEDLCFFQGRDEFFETVTHEFDCFVRVRDEAFAEALRALGAWTDRTEDFHGRLFSLDDAKDFAAYK